MIRIRRLTRKRWRYGTTDATRLLAAARLLRRQPAVLDGIDVVVIEDVPLLTRVERFVVRSIVGAARGDVIASYGHVRHLPQAPSSRSLARLRRLARWEEVECGVIPSGCHSERRPEGPESRNRDRPQGEAGSLYREDRDSSTPPLRGSARNDNPRFLDSPLRGFAQGERDVARPRDGLCGTVVVGGRRRGG